MDLGAYIQIGELGKVAKENNIYIPRLRGYRLMEKEDPVPQEEISEIIKSCEVDVCEKLCRSLPFWDPNAYCTSYGDKTDCLCNYYLVSDIKDGHTYFSDIRWDKIHGWKRKILKFEIKKKEKHIQEYFDTWNKYAGKKNVLYIHARLGGMNWSNYDANKLSQEPWFLEKIDDYYDETYCDIYASIK